MADAEKKALLGAAKYVRAATHFTLANTWGDVPLTLTTDAQRNIENGRTPASEVYAAVIKDLEEAAADLPATVNTANSKTVHNRYQALALLARVYLYQKNWAKAEAAASEVIGSGQYQLVTAVNNVFKRGSREAIFSYGHTGTGLLYENRAAVGWVTLPGSASQTTTSYCHIPSVVMSNFEPGDQRNVSGNWTINLFTKTFSNKYLYNSAASAATIAANPQDFIYQRLAELYLIRAEARAQQNNLPGAASDLNAIRTRAGLPNTAAATQAELLAAVEKERVCELFYEGHRWYDLKRTGRLNAVLSALPWKKDNYKPHMELLPIPATELIANPRISQNPGY
ncbi:MAG: RagB/SusD family nutrient uptake outer membrane protein [Haliscomenobacter sp.]|nr:RagB/SusD family nutrient uptake outer membrane protein [Haliscomenobacter sp.]